MLRVEIRSYVHLIKWQPSAQLISTKNIEVWAEHALQLAVHTNYPNLVIKSDSLQTPHVFWRQENGQEHEQRRLLDCLHLLNSLSSVMVSFAYGELNQIADILTQHEATSFQE